MIRIDHVGLSELSDKAAAQMLRFVRLHGLEGVVAKRADPGQRLAKQKEVGPAAHAIFRETIRSGLLATRVLRSLGN